MQITLKILKTVALFLVFWLLVFDFQRILFSIHNWDKFASIGFFEWLGAFIYSFRLDLAAAGFLSVIPFLFYWIYLVQGARWAYIAFRVMLIFEVVICAFIHAGEINAYPEWNHKLTSRVFTHLSNPDEVFRTADYSMTIWFIIYSILEIAFGWKISKWMFKKKDLGLQSRLWLKLVVIILVIPVASFIYLLLARGGTQPIPINSDAAYYSKNYTANDLSVNSTYFFAKSFLLYTRADIDQFIPNIPEDKARQNLADFFNYPTEHDVYIFDTKRPNVVFIILESWTANAIGSLTGGKSATPEFDKLTEEGLLFTKVYATGGTSEIGNASIFSGYPALPEISISMQSDKHRKIPCLNQDLEEWGYSSSYIFSGDLKYGNIGGFFVDHGFDVVEDESDFPKNLKRGKLNYFDEDLYNILLRKINKTDEPFLHCAFTGSTHSPYDYPKNKKFERWTGEESTFMNSMGYADHCLIQFLEKCKTQSWYKNTIFVLVADHGHASYRMQNPSSAAYFHVPLLIIGEPLKQEFRGKRIEKIGSQTDIVRTLLYQMGGDYKKYNWSKDLLNPNVPEFALHTLNRGYGWITPSGNFSRHFEGNYPEVNYAEAELKKEFKRCQSMMSLIYQDYKGLN